MSSQRTGQIVELQSVRGIAASLVMFGHPLVYYDLPPWFRSIAIVSNGRAAVVVFFVLSGYVLTRSLRNSLFNQQAVLQFYVQRLFRIYPAIWAASVLGLLYIVDLHWRIPVDHVGPLVRSEFRVDRYDALHIIASFAGMTTFILPQLWTIFVELVASVLMPGIAFVALHRQRLYPWALGGAVVVSFAIPNTYYHVTMYLMDFLVGAALVIPGVANRLFGRLPARTVIAIAAIGLLLSQHLPFDGPLANLFETTLAATIVGILICGSSRVGLLRAPFLLFIGDISYSIYLLHYVVACTIAKGFAVAQSYLGIDVDVVPLAIGLATMTALVTIPLAWASYIYVEKPGILLGKSVVIPEYVFQAEARKNDRIAAIYKRSDAEPYNTQLQIDCLKELQDLKAPPPPPDSTLGKYLAERM